MKIEKAIEILGRHHKAAVCQLHRDIGDATQLGIEALKRLVREREYSDLAKLELLSGETK